MKEIQFLVEKFNLEPHPEGGYFKETYRSAGTITNDSLPKNYKGERNYSTCIYFLLTSETFSAFHKIKQDEIWHFYAGSPLKLFMISDQGDYLEQIIGNDFKSGQLSQYVVPGGYWFAAKTIASNSYSFVGCTVSPGFDFEDFELADQRDLMNRFPKHAEIISRLTRS